MKGDVVLISFPFTDFPGTKVRSAVVLMETELDVTVAFVTSKIKWQGEFDVILEPTESNGLKQTSLIRITKLTTLEKQLVLGQIGELSFNDGLLLNDRLKTALKIY